MKRITQGLIVFLLLISFISVQAQDEKQKQLWYCWEETVHPEHIEAYFAANGELVQLCKDEGFDFYFYTWTTGDFKYQWWHPIESLGEIEKVEAAWDKIFEKYGKEKTAAFQKTLKSHYSKTITQRYDWGIHPENPRLIRDSVNYMEFQEFYVIPGKEAAFGKTMKKAVDYLISKGHNDTWNMARGELGYEGPVYIGWSFGKNKADFVEQDQKFGEEHSDFFKELNSEFLENVRTINRTEGWFIKNLSIMQEN